MKKIITLIEEKMKAAFAKCDYDDTFGKVSVSDRPDLCEYQCNGALSAAKTYRKNPIAIAEEVVNSLKDEEMFESIEAIRPGFINIKLNSAFLAAYLNEMNESDNLGCLNLGSNQTVVVDYGGPNVAKPLHIGHLRPAIIGESIKRIKRFSGYNVIGDVHLGDWGLQMGLVMEGLMEEYPELEIYKEDKEVTINTVPFTVNDLEKIYPSASKRSKEDEEFAKLAHDATYKLQTGHKGYRTLWKRVVELSINDLKENYKKLNVEFDIWNGESDAQPYIPNMIERMKKDGYLYESQGALVVDVSKDDDAKEIPPCIIVKSDGASLYSTTDLATLIQREEDYKPVEVIYVVDKRQEMHFTQVFRCAKKTKIVNPNTELKFIGFGTMNGSDGKPFKTRDGGVLRLENLIKEVESLVAKRLEDRDFSSKEIEDISRIVGLAALKYGDLSNQANKDYIFDLNRFCEFEGNTGPYILYMMVRIKSILKKFNSINNDFAFAINKSSIASEKDLELNLARLSDVIETACKENAPHKICQYIYSVSDKFSSFYHDVNILNEDNKEKKYGYISLITLTHKVLKTCIELLGFNETEVM